MKQYFVLDIDNKVDGIFNLEDDIIPDVGGAIYVENPTPFPPGWPSGSTPTEELYWIANAAQWVETAGLGEAKAGVIKEVDAFADLCRLSVVGDAARVKEYERAQAHAEAYRDSGWVLLPVPRSVASWASAKGWTAQQAAEDILAASDRWYAALDGIRELRLKAKEDIRASAHVAHVYEMLATFKATLSTVMEGVV